MKHRQRLKELQPTIDNLAGGLLADRHPCCAMHDTGRKPLQLGVARVVQQTCA